MSEGNFYPFYGGTPPHESGSSTSLAAAQRARGNGARDRLRVLRFFEQRGELGATDDEIEQALSFLHQTASPRRVELAQAGLIRRTKRRRPTRHGSPADVWVLGLGKFTPRAHNHAGALAPSPAGMRRALAALYKLCGGKPRDLVRPDVLWLQDLVELCSWVEAVANVLDPEAEGEPVDCSRVCWGEPEEPEHE